jgi:hypothetical protein
MPDFLVPPLPEITLLGEVKWLTMFQHQHT